MHEQQCYRIHQLYQHCHCFCALEKREEDSEGEGKEEEEGEEEEEEEEDSKEGRRKAVVGQWCAASILKYEHH